MKLFLSPLVASVLFATTANAKECKDLKIGEETIVPGEEYLHDHNAKLMTEQMLERDLPGNAYRAFHPKTIGCLSGTFTVDKKLPKDLRVGSLFKTPGAQFDAFARISHVTPIYPPDSVGDAMPLGKSIGLILDGVDGKKLQPAFEDSKEFHFLMNSAEEFWCPDMECMAAVVTSIRRSKDRPTIPSNPDNIFAQVGELAAKGPVYAETMQRILDENAYGSSQGHVGATAVWSQAPFSFGPGRAVKFALYPCTEDFHGEPLMDPEADGFDPNFMTTRLNATQAEGKHLCYKLKAQFQEDPCKQPIEDASVKWETKEVELGEVVFTSTVTRDEDPKCQNAVFQPYMKTKEFKPLGGLNRGRLYAYQMIGEARQALNGYKTAPHGALPGRFCPAMAAGMLADKEL
jgi:hypothetical protein